MQQKRSAAWILSRLGMIPPIFTHHSGNIAGFGKHISRSTHVISPKSGSSEHGHHQNTSKNQAHGPSSFTLNNHHDIQKNIQKTIENDY